MKYLAIWLIKFYRKYISPIKTKSTCRFYPTCSCYAIEAYEKHGFFLGTYLAVKRLIKCNPFCRGGVDHVPEKITFGKKTNTQQKNGEK